MGQILDTTVLVDHLRNIKSLDLNKSPQEYTISAITAFELIQGSQNRHALTIVKKLNRSLHVLPLTPSISQTASNLLEQYSLSHGLLILNALIAATALTHHLTLVTANTKHFSYLPGLKLKASP